MATYTSNLNLKKPALDDDALITDINNNMDILDAAANGIQDAMAIVANGNTHVAITSGQFVYVRNHSTLTEGLYVASSNIAANATLSSSNLTADSKGGLNALSEQIAKVGTSASAGNVSSKSDLDSALDTLLSGMGTNEIRSFGIYTTTAFDIFSRYSDYFGTIYKINDNTYSHVELKANGKDVLIEGRRNSDGWSYRSVFDDIESCGITRYVIPNNGSISYKNNGHISFVLTSSSNTNGILVLVSTGGSATAITGTLPSSISISKTSGSGTSSVITVSNTVGWDIYAWIFV